MGGEGDEGGLTPEVQTATNGEQVWRREGEKKGGKKKMDAPSREAGIRAGVCKVCVSAPVGVCAACEADRGCVSSCRGSGWEECR